MWNGLDAKGNPISMTATQMTDWAMRHDQHISIAWSAKKQFDPSEVTDPSLKNARLVTLAPGEKTYAEAARRAGWDDMADRFVEAGL